MIEDKKARLIHQLKSSDTTETLVAQAHVKAHGWLMDGSLHGANLANANLQRAGLLLANLDGANLANANLQAAVLMCASLPGANLAGANLQAATLKDANLQGANLANANLQAADLQDAILQGSLWLAELQEMNLEDARFDELRQWWQSPDAAWLNLEDAHFDENTILPDGSNWTPETDLERFTDPAHPLFWRPEPDEAGNLPWWYEPEIPAE